MKNYERPIVMINEDLAEGVYAYSGYCDGDCYTIKVAGHQLPEGQRLTHKFQFDADHIADTTDGHCGSGQILVITFTKAVKYVNSNGTLLSGDGTETLAISYAYTQNAKDEIGLGDLEVTVLGNESDTDLDVAEGKMVLLCNHIKNW